MILTAMVAALLTAAPTNDAVQLSRVYKQGEKLTYEIKSNLSAQHRQYGLQTWIPEDFDMNYQFTIEVKAMKADGIADVVYKRPTITVITGETFDNPPKTDIEKVNYNMLMSVSPVNEILNVKDLNPPKKEKPGKKGGEKLARYIGINAAAPVQSQIIGQFVQEIHRLALFTGSFDSSLDFAPRLPFEKLAVGDTWKRTVGYSPQKLKGKNGKTVNQRLDYLFTYKGIVDSNGKKVHRVVGDCVLDSNLADYINEMFEMKPSESGLKSIPLKLKTQINFDLDLATMKTLQAVANSEGGFKFILTDLPDEAVEEETFKGRTTLRLVSQTMVKPGKPGKATR